MQRNWLAPALLIGSVAILTAAVSYPYLRGAQEPRYDLRRNEPQPVGIGTISPLVTAPSAENNPANVKAGLTSVPALTASLVAAGADDPPSSFPKPTIAADKVKTSTDGSIYRNPITGVYTYNQSSAKIIVTVPATPPTGAILVAFRNGKDEAENLLATTSSTEATFVINDLKVLDEVNRFRFAWLNKSDKTRKGAVSDEVVIKVQKLKPRIVSVDPQNFTFRPNAKTITVQFTRETPLKSVDSKNISSANGTAVTFASKFHVKGEGSNTEKVTDAQLDDSGTAVILTVGDLAAGNYQLTIDPLEDIYGNIFEGTPPIPIVKPVGSDLPLVAPGIVSGTGPYVPYREYTEPRKNPEGFNPGDHVETRVVRLYYFRDAHRVAQIINRDVKSYNRVAVDTRRRLAEQARTDATNQSMKRKVYERDAVQSAQDTRVQEHQLQDAQQKLQNAAQRRDKGENDLALAQQTQDAVAKKNSSDDDKTKAAANVTNAQAALDALKDDLDKARDRVATAQAALQGAQSAEVQKREVWQSSLDQEDKLKADQFRLETAAMHEDPDTYAPGHPHSNDPVRQVSISVIGESEIHLRGPISGINVIREMVDRIDAPTGQVRIAVHTVQVNGERQDKMEKVIGEIQDYIDHSRFLTQQSALMLRKAVLKVASRQAMYARQLYPHDTQEDRDQRYLYAFFGKDFIEELRVQKSEFLYTGNKLLSLNSMDTTSLASALFVLALAKNDTRQEILFEFKQMLGVELPLAEQTFYEAGGSRSYKNSGWNCGCFPRKQCMELMANNARFQSFLGFFDAEVTGAETLNPLQREFVKLAQIMKSRLVTEMEFKQRVMERALVEDRSGGNYLEDLKYARLNELDAKNKLQKAQDELRNQQDSVLQSTYGVDTIINAILKDLRKSDDLDRELKQGLGNPKPADPNQRALIDTIHGRILLYLQGKSPVIDKGLSKKVKLKITTPKSTGQMIEYTYTEKSGTPRLEFNPDDKDSIRLAQEWAAGLDSVIRDIQVTLDKFGYDTTEKQVYDDLTAKLVKLRAQRDGFDNLPALDIANVFTVIYQQKLLLSHIAKVTLDMQAEFQSMTLNLSRTPPDLQRAYTAWVNVKSSQKYFKDATLKASVDNMIAKLDKGFEDLFKADLARRSAVETMDRSRRPLDHKKMLDMLIDEIQEKYVDLLEGTRSYTSNIDDYIKRLATALDDDFNTQFYLPAFRQIRTVATSWDVTLGQIETTSILTNNRTYAKVDPQASMEFDLPKRGPLISEAFQAGKGLLDTYGALMQDPTFLNLARISGGMPTSTQGLGQNAGVPAIRSVLPGLSRTSDESVMVQNGTGAKSFGTPLDALIPDPAIYKFETGTAYEIRPVIQPDGQSVNFHFNYMYTTNIREPVRADEKHLGRIKRHYIDTNVQLGNYELREISKYQVTLRASRTGKGVPLLQDIPGLGVLFRPLPSAESSLQQNIILGQSTIFPTLFDLMGLRWAPSIADLDPLALTNADFIVRQRKQFLNNRVFDYSSAKVDDALQIPLGERRGDYYRSQQTLPTMHPNGYQGPGMGLRDSHMREGYDSKQYFPESKYIPSNSRDGHLNPNSDAERRMNEKLMNPNYGPIAPEYQYGPAPGMVPYGPGMQPQKEKKPNDTYWQPKPNEKQIPPPQPQPGPPLQLTPQSMNSPSPSSVFTTVRLSSADLGSPDGGMSNARLAVYPANAPPAPRRTLWSMMFGNR
jgi:hypothetical protein